MKKLVTILCALLATTVVMAQFNNEWIDYNKSYYKFRIANNGVYRVSKAALDAAGIGTSPGNQFQLWRNGQQVPVFTSSDGVFGAADYIEFIGGKNDGRADRALYRDATFQLTDRVSLFTDTAAYFLTVNPATDENMRYAAAANNVAGNLLPAAPYVWYTARYDYNDQGTNRPFVNRGYAIPYDVYVYSSSFDEGEMMSSNDIYSFRNGSQFNNRQAKFFGLNPYIGGPDGKLRFSLAGSAVSNRDVSVFINTDSVKVTNLNAFQGKRDSGTIAASILRPSNTQTGETFVEVRNLSNNVNDRVVAGYAEIEYPRIPTANNASYFEFTIRATGTNTYLEIADFNHGNVAPILYNQSTLQRMVGVIGSNGRVQFLIPASGSDRNFVLVSNAAAASAPVTALTKRTFINFSTAANQADFVMISNPLLYLPGGTQNQVELYRQYRASAPGGSFNAKIFDINELVDQFAFGIKMHPSSIKNFLRFARLRFSTAPKYCLLVGKGVNYDEYRTYENHFQATQMQLVPTFGSPASDNMLASDGVGTSLPSIPIGRLSVVNPGEVGDYLEKVKQYDANQKNASQTLTDKLWMKNGIHVIGANDAGLGNLLNIYMDNYKRVIQDTLFGGTITTFNKLGSGTAATIGSQELSDMFQKGISLLTYFGHSSATVLDYNLDDPSQYNNPGKYPMFMLLGCNAGNFFTYDTSRLSFKNSISEKYVLAKNRGSIGVVASTHYGIVSGLNVYATGYYQSAAYKGYGMSVGRNIQDAISYTYTQTPSIGEFLARIHGEQQTLHGDPAVVINSYAQPDYVIEQSNIRINPTFVSVAETNFKVNVQFYNIGKAINDSITVEAKRQYPASQVNPNGLTEVVYRRKIKAPVYVDSFELVLPIIPSRDKGTNRITVTLDTENKVSELSETNNSATRDVDIFEDDLRPIYPYNYAIINKATGKVYATSSDPLAASKRYRMEMDTTELFNSALKVSRDVTISGGIAEFDPGLTYKDSTVYYWRVAVVPATGAPQRWNTFSFVYLQGTEVGFGQNHLYQHTKSETDRIAIDSTTREWKFNKINYNVFFRHSVYGFSGNEDADFSILVNSILNTASVCVGHSLVFNVYNPVGFKPWVNPGGAGGYGGSGQPCAADRKINFEWDDRNAQNRRNMMRFIDSVPNGHYIVVRKILDQPFANESYADTLKKDEQLFGAGNSLYHRLKNAGFTDIDSFNRPRVFVFMYKKNDPTFAPRWKFTDGINDKLQWTVDVQSPDTLGYITSPLFGPAKAWKEAKWRGRSLDAGNGDLASVDVIGVNNAGTETRIFTLNQSQQDFNISSINANAYPYIKLRMRNADSINGTPYNLRWWRLYYDPVPEGALSANLRFETKDTLELGETLKFNVAFKNISETAFADSMRIKVIVVDESNVPHVYNNLPKRRKLAVGDTLILSFELDTRAFPGLNSLYLDVNPDNDQPEQYHFNNFLYRYFYVKPDKYNPLLDVTFDGVHILNRDIVSAKPHIQIKLKDENNFLALNDTAGLTLRLRYPGETNPRIYKWGTDSLRFTPGNPSSGDNTATIDFTPFLNRDTELQDYELTLSGKDRTGNRTGTIEYKVSFQVFNKPMISNLMNYPNPFTTSTAFVFYVTGTEVPQEFKIQIMTITGKIVREITKAELGPIHIGRNITEFKWDGTDQFGGKLANGVYLYRVITSLNGNQLDKFRLNEGLNQKTQDETDKYFNKGYGKMYLMR